MVRKFDRNVDNFASHESSILTIHFDTDWTYFSVVTSRTKS